MSRKLACALPLTTVVLVGACSSAEPATPLPGPPPSGASGAGSVAMAGSAGSSAVSGAGTGGSAGAATCANAMDCPSGGFCREGACACPTDKPDVCADPATPSGKCTSKQSDADHCGTCGMKCAPGATCSAGQCGAAPTPLSMSGDCGTIRLAIQGSSVYWVEQGSGKVQTAPITGGSAVLVAGAQQAPSGIAVDGTGLYWVTAGDGTIGSSKIWKKSLPLAAGEPELLKAAPSTDEILAIAVRAGKLYYALGHDVHALATEAGDDDIIVGTATNLDASPPTGVPSGEPAGLAVDETFVFWTTATRQGVERDDIVAGTSGYVELGESQGSLLLHDIESDGTHAYWANGDQLLRAQNDVKGGVTVTKTSAFDAITAFAINASDVYFGGAEGTVFKHSLTPPADPNDDASIVPPAALARDQMNVSSVALDGTRVYWASGCALLSAGL